MVKMGSETRRPGSSKLDRQGVPLRETRRGLLSLPKTCSRRMERHLKQHYLLGFTSSNRSPPSSRKSTFFSLAYSMTYQNALKESSPRTACFSLCPRCTSEAIRKRIPAYIIICYQCHKCGLVRMDSHIKWEKLQMGWKGSRKGDKSEQNDQIDRNQSMRDGGQEDKCIFCWSKIGDKGPKHARKNCKPIQFLFHSKFLCEMGKLTLCPHNLHHSHHLYVTCISSTFGIGQGSTCSIHPAHFLTSSCVQLAYNHIYLSFHPMQSYKATQIIGQGSFGCVYLAHNESAQPFALKKIKVNPFQIQQAMQEIELMKQFSHPNLLKVYDYHLDEEKEEMQIIMEYCPLGDLSHLQAQKKTLPPVQIMKVFRQILKGFLAMGVKGVIHRDLKPENILLSQGGIVKIGDFGCARMIGALDMSKVDNFSLDKGTFLYASPQQLRNQAYSSKCDVWAAGCIAYLLAFGVHPFLDSKPHNTLLLIKKYTEGKQMEVPAQTDPSLAKLISLCLVYEDQERASWHQIWLSRVFAPRVADPRKFVQYLRSISSIGSWIAKEFWRLRKDFAISKNSDEIFIYFIIKFQATVLKMALKILKKSPNYRYLFDQNALAHFQPSQDHFNEIKRGYLQHEKYFLSIKKAMQGKESFAEISVRQTKRGGCFSDLQKSIRACYKILTQVRGNPKANSNVWIALSQWLNFETWFAYEKDPKLDRVTSESSPNAGGVIQAELRRYEAGIVE